MICVPQLCQLQRQYFALIADRPMLQQQISIIPEAGVTIQEETIIIRIEKRS